MITPIKTLLISCSLVPLLACSASAMSFGESFLKLQGKESQAMAQAAFVASEKPNEFKVITKKMQFEQQAETIQLLEEMVANQKIIIQLLKSK